MFYILRQQHGGLWVEKETGCRTLAAAEAWIGKQRHNAGSTFIVCEDIMSYTTGITITKKEKPPRTRKKGKPSSTAAKNAA